MSALVSVRLHNGDTVRVSPEEAHALVATFQGTVVTGDAPRAELRYPNRAVQTGQANTRGGGRKSRR